MPINATIGSALIGAGSNLLSGIFSSAGAANMNSRNRRHQWDTLKENQRYNDQVNAEARAYNDKVNAETREWNSESAHRQRIEAAGYNPYLFNSPSSLGSASVGANSTSGGYGLTMQNEMQGLANGLGAAVPSFQDALLKDRQIKAQETANSVADYNFKKQMDNDNLVVNGKRAYFSSGIQSHLQIETARSEANIRAVEAWAKNMYMNYMSGYVKNEDGTLKTDENGNYVTNFDSIQDTQRKSAEQSLEKLIADVQKTNGEVLLQNWDILEKQYRFQFLPQQVKAEIGFVISQIKANNASAEAAQASAGNSRANAKLLGQQFEMNEDTRGAAREAAKSQEKFNKSWYGRNVHWWLDPFLGSAGQVLGGAKQGAEIYYMGKDNVNSTTESHGTSYSYDKRGRLSGSTTTTTRSNRSGKAKRR